jgi:acetyltransferase-like isoleucine patch superfamily enzyme
MCLGVRRQKPVGLRTSKLIGSLTSIASFIFRTPGRIGDFVNARRKRRRCILLEGAVLYPSSRISNNQTRESIVIGAHSRILAILETMGHGGRVEIGSHCFIGENTRISSSSAVRIGDRVLISHDVNIFDNNSHSDSAMSRARHFEQIFSGGHPKTLLDVPTFPIVIENDAWIGFGAAIFKGVTIGEGAIVGACSVVTKDVAPYTIVVGNPARVIGQSSR